MCKSTLKLIEHEITFANCVPGGTYVKDISLWNVSEIPTAFRIISKVKIGLKPVMMMLNFIN